MEEGRGDVYRIDPPNDRQQPGAEVDGKTAARQFA
jgi:hypothetical protein